MEPRQTRRKKVFLQNKIWLPNFRRADGVVKAVFVELVDEVVLVTLLDTLK